MKTHITIFAALLLAACQPAPEPTLKVKEYNTYVEPEQDRMTVQVVWLDDPTRYCALREGTLRNEKDKYLGCSALVAKGTVCEIAMAKPKDFNDNLNLEVLGHEVLHCMGAAHD